MKLDISSAPDKLAVVMPVYNEEESIIRTVTEWAQALDQLGINWQMILLDDGSKDSTPKVLKSLQDEFGGRLTVERHENCGHGQTCVRGYRMALDTDAKYIFQIDSDGQCEPKYFNEFWANRKDADAIFGNRVMRSDGFLRHIVSRVVSLVVFSATRIWLRDANVPYRLLTRDLMTNVIDKIPKNFYLANIYVSVLVATQCRIKWIPIGFRARWGGTPSVRFLAFIKHGLRLWRELRQTKIKN